MSHREWHAREQAGLETWAAFGPSDSERDRLRREQLEAEYVAGGPVERRMSVEGEAYYVVRGAPHDFELELEGEMRVHDAREREALLKDLEPPKVNVRLSRPPGSLTMRLTRFLPSGKRLRKDLEQVVADMRAEHFDALAIGDSAAARVALVRGHFEMARALLPSWWGAVVSFVARWLGVAGV